jgi:repressor LexA
MADDENRLTPRQREILDWVKEFIQEHGMPPTVREIGRAFGIKSSSVFDLLKALERKGFLRRGNLGARSLILEENASCGYQSDPLQERAEPKKKSGRTTLVPIPVVGTVAAGQPIFAEENIIGEVLIDERTARRGRCFGLEVKGDSMVNAGIRDEDMVIVRQQPVAESGDIVVALLGDEATVKRLYIRDERIELRPENPKHWPMVIGPGDEMIIQGKVVGIKRKGARNAEIKPL